MRTSWQCHRLVTAICLLRRSHYFWFWQAPFGLPELHLSRDDYAEVERNFRVPPRGVQNAGATGVS